MLVGPKLVGVPAIKAQIESKVSALVQGRVTWEALDVRLLPFPRAILRRAALAVPGAVNGRAEEIIVELRLLPLLHGQAEVASVRVVRPMFTIVIGNGATPSSTPGGDPVQAYRSAMEPVARALKAIAPDTEVAIEDGSVDFRAGDLPPVQLTKLSVQARTSGAGATVKLSSESNLWSRLQLDARLGLNDLQAKAAVDVVELKAQTILDRFVPAPMSVTLTPSHVHIEALTDGRSNLQGSVSVEAPSVGFARGEKRLEFAELAIKGAVLVDAQHTEITLSEVRLGKLLPSGSLSLRVQHAGPAEVEVTLPQLDLVMLRDAALGIAGDQEAVREYAPRVHAGTVSDLRVQARAATLGTLLELENLSASLMLKDAAARIPYVDREVAGINGALEVRSGTLKAQTVSGHMGELRVADGTVDLSLRSGDIAIASNIDVDLAQTLALVRSLLPKDARASIAPIRTISGRAKGAGTFTLKRTRWDASIAIAQSDSRAQTDWVPWPLAVKEGKIAFSADRLGFSGARGSVGASTIADAAAEFSYSGPFRIDRASGQVTAAFDEIYPWLRSLEGLTKALQPVKSIVGTAEVRVNRIAGRPDDLDKLDYDGTVQPHSVAVDIEGMPAPVTLAGGSAAINPSTITLDGVGTTLLDSQAKVSGSLNGYRGKAWAIDGKVADGTAAEKLVRWVWRSAKIRRRFEPKTPFSFTAQRLRFNASQQLDAQVAAQFAGGLKLGANLAWDAGALDVRQLSIKDKSSDATIAVKMRDQTLDVGFKGTLVGESVVAIFRRSANHPGRLSGDLRVVIDRKRPELTSGIGKLEGTNWDLNWLVHVPIKVSHISLDAERAQTRITEATIDWAGQTAQVTGQINHTSTGPVVDAKIDSPGIVVDALVPAGGPEGEVEDGPGFGTQTISWIWPMIFTGRVAVRTEHLQYRNYRIEPVEGTLTLEREHAHLVVQNAQLCGVSFPFTLDATPQGISATAQLSAQNQGIEKTALCLSGERVVLSGRLDMQASLTTHGTDEASFLSNLVGSVALEGHDGKLMKMPLIGNILRMKNIAGMFKTGVPKLDDTGFPYKSVVIAGHIQDGRMFFDQAAFDSDAMGLVASGSTDLNGRDTKMTVLFALFGGLDRLVRKIPLVGYVVGGALTSIPISVSGDMRDPTVVPLGARAVGTELLGVFERALKLPVKVFDPEAMATPVAPAAPK